VLNAAREILFLVSGDKKADALHAVLEGGADTATRPAAGVRPATGTRTWLVDEAAAARLARRAA
jgi:6-phosphogluconolactonase